jgi:hypothetical protein
MTAEETTLVGGVVARMIKRFSMAAVAPEAGEAAPPRVYVSRRHRLELHVHGDLSMLYLRSVPLNGPVWGLTLRGIGSARNWLTAEIDAVDALDRAAIELFFEIDRALDGLLRRAFLARQSLLARRRDALVQMSRAILVEHAALQRLDHELDRHAREHETPSIAELFANEDDLRNQWLATPETSAFSERRRVMELGAAGSKSEGYRFYLECVMHAASAEEAAQYLAGELASMLHDGQLSASIEPIDRFASFINEQLRLFSDVVSDVRGDAEPRPAQAASSFQIAMERLGA